MLDENQKILQRLRKKFVAKGIISQNIGINGINSSPSRLYIHYIEIIDKKWLKKSRKKLSKNFSKKINRECILTKEDNQGYYSLIIEKN